MSLYHYSLQEEKTQSSAKHDASMRRYLPPLQTGADVFLIVTIQGEMQEVSSSWQHFTGQNKDEYVGRGWLNAVHPADQPQVDELLQQVCMSGRVSGIECHIREEKGEYQAMHLAAIPTYTADEVVCEIILFGNCISTSQLTGAMSEAQVQLALKVSGVGMWDWDLLTNQLTWTTEERTLFGLAPDTPLTYENFLATLHPDDRERILQLHVQALAEHTEYSTEYRVCWPDGSMHWLADKARGIYDDQGQPVHMVGATVDVTHFKQTEEALRESELRFRRLIESNIIGIVMCDMDGNIYEANEAFLSLVGYTQEDVAAGRVRWTELTPPEYQVKDHQANKEMLRSGAAQPFEKEYITKDGKRVPVLVGVVHLLQDTSSRMVIAFVVDLTARKELEQQKDLMLSVTGHELKTPLAALKGTFQLIQRRIKSLVNKSDYEPLEVHAFLADFSERLTGAIRQVDTQTHLINDLLDVSRITARTLELEVGTYDLVTLVRDAVKALRTVAPERVFLFELPEYTAVPVYVDAVRISQVVTNYVTNAIRYSSPTEPIQIGLTVQENIARVWVRDRGPGLSEEAQKHIWQRFSRIKGMSMHNNLGKGLGLGLYICQTLIAQHHGEVGVESTLGQGSTFWFTLPLAAS